MPQIASRAVLALTLISTPVSFAAAQGPACDAANVGTVACFVSTLCACTFTRGGAMTGAVSGYRWDCGVLRPSCGGDTLLPATIDPFVGQLPAAISLDRNQTIINTQTGAGSSNQTVSGNRASGASVNQPILPGRR